MVYLSCPVLALPTTQKNCETRISARIRSTRMGGYRISTENMSSLEVSLSAHCSIRDSLDSEGFEVSLPSPHEELSGQHPDMFPPPVRMTRKRAGKKSPLPRSRRHSLVIVPLCRSATVSRLGRRGTSLRIVSVTLSFSEKSWTDLRRVMGELVNRFEAYAGGLGRCHSRAGSSAHGAE